jgi:hypothetical protein
LEAYGSLDAPHAIAMLKAWKEQNAAKVDDTASVLDSAAEQLIGKKAR